MRSSGSVPTGQERSFNRQIRDEKSSKSHMIGLFFLYKKIHRGAKVLRYLSNIEFGPENVSQICSPDFGPQEIAQFVAAPRY